MPDVARDAGEKNRRVAASKLRTIGISGMEWRCRKYSRRRAL